MIPYQRILVASAGLAFATACATTPPAPPPQAVLDISEKVCAGDMDLTQAVTMTPERRRQVYDMRVAINAETNCKGEGEEKANYVLLELPANGPNHVVTVGGAKETLRMLASTVTLLDETGEVSRTFAPEKYMDRGNTFAVQFRPADKDRYVLVETNPASVGEVEESFRQTMNIGTGTAYVGGGYSASYTTYSGAEVSAKRTLSHEGVIAVKVHALKGKVGELPQ